MKSCRCWCLMVFWMKSWSCWCPCVNKWSHDVVDVNGFLNEFMIFDDVHVFLNEVMMLLMPMGFRMMSWFFDVNVFLNEVMMLLMIMCFLYEVMMLLMIMGFWIKSYWCWCKWVSEWSHYVVDVNGFLNEFMIFDDVHVFLNDVMIFWC